MVSRWETVPNLPPNLVSLGNSFQRRFPNRDQASDGAWGDADHKLSPSGHNLDDTPGSLSESEDADNKPELRAIDVDSDLREAGATMQLVIDRIVADPYSRSRLYYIIYNRRIIGSHTGWKWVSYTGSNAHTLHAHFSGTPGADENGALWAPVINYGKVNDVNLDDKIGGDTGFADRTVRHVLQDLARRHEWEHGKYGQAPFVPKEDSTLRNLEKVRFIDENTKTLLTRLTAVEKDVATHGRLLAEIHAAVTSQLPPAGGTNK